MKTLALLLFALMCCCSSLRAQTFLEHVEQQTPGQGKVTVTESSELDQLVNGAPKQASPTPTHPVAKPTTPAGGQHAASGHNATEGEHAATGHAPAHASGHDANTHKPENKPESRHEAEPNKETETEEVPVPTIDMRKKVMRGSRKVTGYRVQAYAGGNTRKDRQQAEQIGNAIKVAMPDLPVYVHFYSPRWICRVGNFRNYNDAQRVLRQIRKMGYRSACLVKGQITVQD